MQYTTSNKPLNRGSKSIPVQKGFDLRVVYQNWYAIHSRQFSFDAPQDDWEMVTANPSVKYATLSCRGKLIRKYDPAEEKRTAPLGSNAPFSLMR